jgi:hypothetical protein
MLAFVKKNAEACDQHALFDESDLKPAPLQCTRFVD